ncbi:MAG: hypothetical protein KDD40_04790 [Bdellovibrionales bacterium]|nr:hypothetical protein [Bdellovibrionales bacterium]
MNISLGGVGLKKSNFSPLPEKGEVIPGQLILKNQTIELSLKVIHVTDKIIGCKYLTAPNHLEYVLSKFFQTEFSAHKLIQIDPHVLQSKGRSTPYYFRGANSDELYYVMGDSEIEQFNIIIDSQILVGSAHTHFKFGYVKKLIEDKVHGYKREDPIEWRANINESFIDDCQKFIDNIEMLNSGHRKILQHLLQSARTKNLNISEI